MGFSASFIPRLTLFAITVAYVGLATA